MKPSSILNQLAGHVGAPRPRRHLRTHRGDAGAGRWRSSVRTTSLAVLSERAAAEPEHFRQRHPAAGKRQPVLPGLLSASHRRFRLHPPLPDSVLKDYRLVQKKCQATRSGLNSHGGQNAHGGPNPCRPVCRENDRPAHLSGGRKTDPDGKRLSGGRPPGRARHAGVLKPAAAAGGDSALSDSGTPQGPAGAASKARSDITYS